MFAITSLPADQATPEGLERYIRHHCGIENRLYWVRDVTFNEDSSQIRTGTAHVMANVWNPVISVHRLAGATNIAKLSTPRRATRKSLINSPADFEKTLLLFES